MSPDLSRIFQFIQLFPPVLINDLLFTVESLAGQPWRDLNQFPFPNTIEKLEVAIITTTAPEQSTASPPTTQYYNILHPVQVETFNADIITMWPLATLSITISTISASAP